MTSWRLPRLQSQAPTMCIPTAWNSQFGGSPPGKPYSPMAPRRCFPLTPLCVWSFPGGSGLVYKAPPRTWTGGSTDGVEEAEARSDCGPGSAPSFSGGGCRAWEGVGSVSLWNSGLRWGPWVRKRGWGGGGDPEQACPILAQEQGHAPGCPGFGPGTDTMVVSTFSHMWSKCTQSRTEHVGSQSWGLRGTRRSWGPGMGVLESRSKAGL